MLSEMDLADGDVAFLCSDGVTNVLSDDDPGREASKPRFRALHRHPCAQSARAIPATLDDMSAVVVDIAETLVN